MKAQVTEETFKDQVAEADSNVLLEVYAPWCGHCQHFGPVYREAGEMAIKAGIKGGVAVRRMDGYQNKIPAEYAERFPVKGFPTIFLHKKDSKEAAVVYSGERHEASDLLGWVKESIEGKGGDQ